MANVRSGNTHYVDSTGVLTSEKNIKVAGILVTATSANAVVELSDSAGTTKKMILDVATSTSTQHFDFSNHPVMFPNGINVTTLTNAIATIIYNTGGG